MAIPKTTIQERSWGDVFDVIDRVIDNVDAGGATVPTATTTVAGVVKKSATQADFAGADITALKVELNAFLAKLKAAGISA